MDGVLYNQILRKITELHPDKEPGVLVQQRPREDGHLEWYIQGVIDDGYGRIVTVMAAVSIGYFTNALAKLRNMFGGH